ncbi:MAG: HNH endonuclease [Proteobacteria bacterium]|nr:HNH endonuclease [Pseudomonadota bacterium]
MKFQLEESLRGAPDESVLDDLRRVAKSLEKDTVTRSEYNRLGIASSGMIERRFGSWNKGLASAGLKIKVQKDIPDDDLFENLKQVWIKLGRQPRYSEIRSPVSLFSNVTYDKRFGSYSEALKKFIAWVNADAEGSLSEEIELIDAKRENTPSVKSTHRSRREISERQRFRILVRDGFRCKSCGASPLLKPGTELHVDHIIPWSKGGETVDDNLEVKCKQCNLGKNNAFNV